MKLIEILKKYYTYEQLIVIPKMFKKIGIIGQNYITIFEKEFENDYYCLKYLADIVQFGEERLSNATNCKITLYASNEEIAKELWNKILHIYNNAKTGREIIMKLFNTNEANFLCDVIERKECGYIHIEDYYYSEDVLEISIEFLFEDEIKFTYNKIPNAVTLKMIFNAAKKSFIFGKYNNIFNKEEIERYKMLLSKV